MYWKLKINQMLIPKGGKARLVTNRRAIKNMS